MGVLDDVLAETDETGRPKPAGPGFFRTMADAFTQAGVTGAQPNPEAPTNGHGVLDQVLAETDEVGRPKVVAPSGSGVHKGTRLFFEAGLKD